MNTISIIQSIIDGTAGDDGTPRFVDGIGIRDSVVFKSVDHGVFTMHWLVEEHLCHSDNMVQGGVVNVIADIGQSFAFWSTAEAAESYSTADFHTRFFRPIPAGATMIVESRVVNRSRRMGVIDTTFIHSETGKLHAKVTGGWMLAKRDFTENSKDS